MKKTLIVLVWVAVVVLALQFRGVGLYRGLETGGIYHPDEPKQVLALWRYLNDKYLWHIGSVFYDGYPYGLNHVDEWVLRPVLAVSAATSRLLDCDRPVTSVPEVSDLYYLTRGLRVVYGMLAVLLCLAVSKKLSFSRSAMWYTALLLALAPISITVTHFITGDVGTNLFGALMLFFLCVYSKSHRSYWLFLSGMSVGMAFACKYNGLLAGCAVGLYLLLNTVFFRDWKWFLWSCGVLVAGVMLGIIVLTPALLLDWDQTSSDIIRNFAFIRNYGSGAWWSDMSAGQKTGYVLFKTAPRILSHFGWLVIISALAGLFFSGREILEKVRAKAAGTKLRQSILVFSVFMYPFVAFCLSIVGKPEVHPFHFSYLQIPFVLGAVYGVGQVGRYAVRPTMRLVVLCLVIATAFELGLTSRKDSFFWARRDNSFISHQVPEILFTKEGRGVGKSEFLRNITLESENAAVFRNRRAAFNVHGGAFWRDLRIAPVPSVPYPVAQDWIFANGPVFPRNERMFKVKRETVSERHIVYHDKPASVSIGVRSGSWPVEVRIEVGGVKETARLAPNSQKLITMTPKKWRKMTEGEGDIFHVPLEVGAVVGDAYITVCLNSSDAAAFRTFGGDTDKCLLELPKGISVEKLVEEVERTRYIEGDGTEFRFLDAAYPDSVECLFPARQTHEPVSLPLACGKFIFECEVLVISEKAEILLQIDDARYVGVMAQSGKRISLQEGHNIIKYAFSKKLAPYQCSVVAKCLEGKVRVGDWALRPDTAAIQEDIQAWREDGTKPGWMGPSSPDGFVAAGGDVVFGGALRITDMVIPEDLKGDDMFALNCGMELMKYPFKDYGEYFAFVHLLDSDGKQVFASGFPVAQAVINSGVQGAVIDLGLLKGVVPGDYTLEMGIWSGRTRKRLSVSGPSVSGKERSKQKIRIGKIRVK